MVLSECREMFADRQFQSVHITHDTLSTGWIINFRDQSGNEYPVTDIYGIACSYTNISNAKSVVQGIGDCPIDVDNTYRYFEK